MHTRTGIADSPSQPRTSNSKALSHQNSANSTHKTATPAAAGIGVGEAGASSSSCNSTGISKHASPNGQAQGPTSAMASGEGIASNGGAGGAAPAPAPSLLTASSSALIELQELRKENTLLHTRLHKAEAIAHALMHNANANGGVPMAGGPNLQPHHPYPHPHTLLHSHGGPGTPAGLPPPAPFRRSPASRATLSQSLPLVPLPSTAEGSSPQPPSTGYPSPPTSVFATNSSGNARVTPPRQPSFLGSNSSGTSSSASGGTGGTAIARSSSSWGQAQGQGRLVAGSPKTGPFVGASGGAPPALSATVSAPLPLNPSQQKHHPNPQQQQHQQHQAGSVGSGSIGSSSQYSDPPSPTLSQITQQMSARSLTSGLRVSTTGQLLAPPAALNTSITSSGSAGGVGSNGVAAPGSSVSGTPVGASRQVLPGMQHAGGVSSVGVATPPSMPLSLPPGCGPGGGGPAGTQQLCSFQSASFSVPGHGTLGTGVLSGGSGGAVARECRLGRPTEWAGDALTRMAYAGASKCWPLPQGAPNVSRGCVGGRCLGKDAPNGVGSYTCIGWCAQNGLHGERCLGKNVPQLV
ncbi:hypothetical protein DUNSADRAFT_11137 [Dunaliella salina]|uniref:Uncharacterized protein n=1 Tax=Dunaliella salina TaxID=3046 RepID=A0ABQ7H4N2_DUNSA|nr:hypothetical protein DUNSADRAFT_11137 [Dunaliella salina]|eukprot:KAF5841821.1 hypothetical protein DUNSADRAFT_11137 [Dunaliella salina]